MTFTASGRALPTLLRISLVLLSLAFTLSRPFYGHEAALPLTVLFLVYLPGYLLARALGKDRVAHPVMRFVWVLAAGLALTITLGGAARLLQVPVPHYLLLLHGLMAVLALLPSRPDEDEAQPWQFEWSRLPLYLLLLLSCAIVLAVGIERNRFRFSGYEDQTVFVELANWLAHDPDDPTIDSRRLNVHYGATRWDFDGWTYNHAAWAMTSGLSEADIIWYHLTPLFVWTAPLAVFGMAYELSRNERTAVLSAAALTLVGLMTVDGLVYRQSTLVIGQFSLFQVNTLRTMATAIGAPLALMAAAAYLRRPSARHLLLVFLIGGMLSILHARPIMTFLYTIGATTILWWLAQPTRQRLAQAFTLGLVCVVLFGMPYIQRTQRGRIAIPQVASTGVPLVDADAAPIDEDEPTGDPRGDLLPLSNVPLIGDTYIVSPKSVFYHPAIIVATALGLLAGLYWRRSLTAKYVFASTATTMILLFTPGLTPIVTGLTSPTVIASLIFAVPVGVILGWAAHSLLSAVAGNRTWQANLVVAAAAAAAMLALLLEPFPIPASARDQIRASNALQLGRDVQPADLQMTDVLRDLLPQQGRHIIVSPNDVGNFITESVPRTLITGARPNSNPNYAPTARFMSEENPPAPWLDSQDLAFLRETGVTHIVMRADLSRLPQMVMQPDRFEHLGSSPGYEIFRVNASGLEADARDELFAEMNRLYTSQLTERWTGKAFDTGKPGNPDWLAIAERWQALGDDDLAVYGQAFSLLLAAQDSAALPLWQWLNAAYPEQALITDALAGTHVALGAPEAGEQVLLAALSSKAANTAVLAARTLLTEPFFYLLDAPELDRVIEATERNATAWDRLASYDQPDAVRARVALLMSEGRWETAESWQNRIAGAEVDPRDLVTRASLALVQGQTQRALDILAPATDPDAVAANRFLHPDRWQDNIAAQMHALIEAEIARDAGRLNDAEAALARAVEAGATWAARAFGADGDAAVTPLTPEAEAQPPEFASLLEVASTGRLYVVDAAVTSGAETVTVTATFGNPHVRPYPVREWRIHVISPDAATVYARTSRAAEFTPGALSRVTFTLELPEDVAPDTPGLVVIEALHNDRVVFPTAYVPVTLNPSE